MVCCGKSFLETPGQVDVESHGLGSSGHRHGSLPGLPEGLPWAPFVTAAALSISIRYSVCIFAGATWISQRRWSDQGTPRPPDHSGGRPASGLCRVLGITEGSALRTPPPMSEASFAARRVKVNAVVSGSEALPVPFWVVLPGCGWGPGRSRTRVAPGRRVGGCPMASPLPRAQEAAEIDGGGASEVSG